MAVKKRESGRRSPLWVVIAAGIMRAISLSDIVDSVRFQLHRAGRHLGRMLLLLVCLSIFLLSAWTCLQLMLFHVLEQYGWSVNAGLFMLAAVNLVLGLLAMACVRRSFSR